MGNSMTMYITQGLIQCLEPSNMLVMVAALFAGIIGGMLPGITVVTAVALFIPFTLGLSPAAALIGMGAVYVGAMYGGSNASILINTPGSPGSIATCYDGYAMTRKGRSEEAICTALVASAVGGVIGAVALMLFFEPLCTIGLKFGSEAFFWMAIFGLCSLGVMEPGNLVRTLLAGALGLAITTVGLDPVGGIPRFTFDIYELQQGFDMVLLMISLFSFSQMLRLVEERSQFIAAYGRQKGALRAAVRSLMKNKILVLLNSLLGTIVGSLPGAGGSIAAILAYNETRRWSKKTEAFGTGTPEGILAPESANNASVGGALVPLMALGIPGSGAAAVLMGGLLAKGLVPGPQLLEKSADVAYTFITSLIVVNPVMIVTGYIIAKLCTRILDVPKVMVIPVVFTLSFLGGFSVRNSMFDVAVLVISGVVAYLLLRARISPAAVGLGVVLGPIVEESLTTTMARCGNTTEFLELLFLSPLAATFCLLSLLSLAAAIVVNRKAIHWSRPRLHRGIFLRYDFFVLLTIAAVCSFFIMECGKLYGEEALFPLGVFSACLGLSLLSLGLLSMSPSEEDPMPRQARNDVLVYILISVITWLAIDIAGFYASIFFCNTAMIFYGNIHIRGKTLRETGPLSLAVAAAVTVVQYALFHSLLNVPTPTGIFI